MKFVACDIRKLVGLTIISVAAVFMGWPGTLHCQDAVVVTARLDTNVVNVGQSTMLRVYGQVSTNVEANAERILTWYVDVFNGDGAMASADYGALVKMFSDNDLLISGNGMDDGDHRRGIYDTFLNLAGAGVSNEVELLAVPVTGLVQGTVQFSVGAGSGVTNLSQDFIVAPLGGGPMYMGGDYTSAMAELEVVGVGCEITLQITRGLSGGGPGGTLDLSFVPCAGFDHTVQFTDVLETGAVWTALPAAPHNTGMVTVTNTVSARFYRVLATAQ